MQLSAVSIYESRPESGRAVATVDSMVTAHERAGGVTHAAGVAAEGPNEVTMVNSVLHGLGLAPSRARRTGPRSVGDYTGSARAASWRPRSSVNNGKPARGGRHAKPASGASRVGDRAMELVRENRRVALAAAVAVALIVIAVLIAGRGGSPAETCGLFYPGKQQSDVCADTGGTASTANRTIRATPLALLDNAAGGQSLCTTIDLTNDSGDDQNYSPADFKIQNPAGEVASTTSGTLRTVGTLASGETATGTLCDDRPVQAGVYALIYDPSVLGAQRAVWVSEH